MELWKRYVVILILALAILLGFWLGHTLFPKTVIQYRDVVRVTIDTTKRDTTILWKERLRISVRDTGRIVYLRDTIIETKPFVASLPDSLYDGDTLNVDYYFPNNMFEVLLRRRPEKVETITNYVTIIKEVEKPEPWYVKPAWTAGGLLIGFGLGSIK